MEKAIYKLNIDFSRMGKLEGVFISTQQKVDKLIQSKTDVYFGEVLGKHSEIYGAIEEEHITFVSDNEEAVKILEEYGLTNGFNPFEYYTVDGGMLIDDVIDELIKKETENA